MKTYTISEITKYIHNMFIQDFILKKVKISGEVSNCKYHQSGHVYFTLKDDDAQISCAMFRAAASRLDFRIENGQSLELSGRIDVYEKSGTYSFYAATARLNVSKGELYLKFEKLKEELEERGMFAPEYKQPIPKYVRTLGVVTAPTGAAVRDIIDVSRRRNPGIQIILYPALVQGDGASASIAAGIRALAAQGVDVMIVGRGGGSIEDLWAFNEEETAQAIFDCPVPVISAVGHETDVTIADFVADLRAPTPSAAAELAVYESERLLLDYEQLRSSLTEAMMDVITECRHRQKELSLRVNALSPANQLIQKKTYLMNLEGRLENAMNSHMRDKRHRLQVYIERMKGLSPLDKLNQGYSVASLPTGERISSVNDVRPGDEFRVYVSDGYLDATVKESMAVD